ncbi:transposase [Clostridium tetani]|uniref:Transposase IS200-like domain-containing protein n=1 Tax=Clostridium tetani (strain Massachusetts / E88) TaxID=212717 RepID=Q895R5_CLOTE|nr:transposase [Clostridium tetani]AAO35775.1 hypothetical protein CTC_01206 [Clostridium tetani E88]KGI38332.1 hypothetical protein KY52_07475 [Clostridium tetani]KGI42780.1 hypothetical protein KY54_12100 [Clostridium tetani]KHO33287.1 hypothetical protein OR63_05895 [Clostridium tetani]KIG21721.1 hypothetical protein RS78_03135 [Clostridium tetani]
MFFLPRTKRQKSENGIYHIMIKSITEVPLFKKHEDKIRYLKQMREYQKIYGFKVYAYCLMSNHGHFIIDSNGADISKTMHGLNFKYAITFNRIYKRNGHLFQDRFKSKMVDTQRYLIMLSAYIHNNPLDIRGYEKCPEKYKYSSLKVYLGLERDNTGLLDERFIMQLFSNNVKEARERYAKLVYICNDEKMKRELEFKDICKVLGNIAQSTVSRLCSIGVELISTEDKYKNLINKFISEHSNSKAVGYT